MILVTLGTQDKEFKRILKAVDKAIEDKVITEEVIVQAGFTKYKSDNMEIFDLIPIDEFNKLIKKASLIITHGGVGSILTGLINHKKVIAIPRLKKYDEHESDHQKQIVDSFYNEGYILKVDDTKNFEKVLEEVKTFKPKRYKSNNGTYIDNINNYIKEDNHTSWYNKLRYLWNILFFVLVGLIIYLIIK
ncbi:MAG: hypothetical protein ILA19_03015 [Bacilli bacterium]|nr:hypothetical protein [Bacilli bacterium]